MNIKFLDLNFQNNLCKSEINKLYKKILLKSSFIGGNELKNFEKNFAKYIGIKYCLGVANGTDAIEISLQALNLKPKSEILVQANTWISSAEAIVSSNFKLKFLDCDSTHSICIEDLKKKISKNTSAIIVTHLYGNTSNILKIKKICKSKKIKIIEDCAQSHGSKWNDKKTGTFGEIATFSFFPSKNLGCFGDGGAIVTSSKKYFLQCKKIANHGGLKKNNNTIIGRNSRLDNLNAGILDIKLKRLDTWIKIRNEQVKLYKKYLNNIPQINFINELPQITSSRYVFIIKVKKRDLLRSFLKKRGVETHCHYPCTLPELPVFKNKFFKKNKNLKIFHENKKIISLPIGEHLNKRDIYFVSNKIIEFFNA